MDSSQHQICKNSSARPQNNNNRNRIGDRYRNQNRNIDVNNRNNNIQNHNNHDNSAGGTRRPSEFPEQSENQPDLFDQRQPARNDMSNQRAARDNFNDRDGAGPRTQKSPARAGGFLQARQETQRSWQSATNDDKIRLHERTNDWLRERLRECGLPTGGNKEDLVDRLAYARSGYGLARDKK